MTPIATEANLQRLIARLPGKGAKQFLTGVSCRGEDRPPKQRRIKTDDLYIMRYSTCSQAVKVGRSTDVERRKKDFGDWAKLLHRYRGGIPGERCFGAHCPQPTRRQAEPHWVWHRMVQYHSGRGVRQH